MKKTRVPYLELKYTEVNFFMLYTRHLVTCIFRQANEL